MYQPRALLPAFWAAPCEATDGRTQAQDTCVQYPTAQVRCLAPARLGLPARASPGKQQMMAPMGGPATPHGGPWSSHHLANLTSSLSHHGCSRSVLSLSHCVSNEDKQQETRGSRWLSPSASLRTAVLHVGAARLSAHHGLGPQQLRGWEALHSSPVQSQRKDPAEAQSPSDTCSPGGLMPKHKTELPWGAACNFTE